MASRKNGTLDTGVTSDLPRRVWEHRDRMKDGFTSRYAVTKPVWYQSYDDIEEAIAHEKRNKRWMRAWKIQLIEAMNPEWRDLYEDIV